MQSITVQCKACRNEFRGNYCNLCGEKVYKEDDKSVVHFASEGLHVVTHFEGTFFRTLRYLFTRPGKLSELYCAGIRKSLFKPLSLFFLLILIYLLFPVFEGLNMRLYYHTHSGFYGDYAMRKATDLMRQHDWSDAQLTQAFHLKSEKVSKFLLLILLPLTALFFWAFTYKKRRYFFDQMVFATEINSLYLIWGFMIMPILLFGFQFLIELISGANFPVYDEVIGIILYTVMIVYIVFGLRHFYRLKLWPAIGLGLLFYLAHFVIVQIIYKFLLFYISISLL